MDIATTILLGMALVATGLNAGLLLADRGSRRQTLRDLADGEARLKVLVESIHVTHNKQVGQIAVLSERLEGAEGRISQLKLTLGAGRLGSTNGSRPQAPKA